MCDTVRPPLRAARHVLLLVVVGLMTVTHAAMRAHPRSPLPQPSYTLSAHRERMLQASDSATITPSPLAPSSSRTVRPSRTPSNTATTTESVTSSPALQLSSTPSPSFTPSPSPSLPVRAAAACARVRASERACVRPQGGANALCAVLTLRPFKPHVTPCTPAACLHKHFPPSAFGGVACNAFAVGRVVGHRLHRARCRERNRK